MNEEINLENEIEFKKDYDINLLQLKIGFYKREFFNNSEKLKIEMKVLKKSKIPLKLKKQISDEVYKFLCSWIENDE